MAVLDRDYMRRDAPAPADRNPVALDTFRWSDVYWRMLRLVLGSAVPLGLALAAVHGHIGSWG